MWTELLAGGAFMGLAGIILNRLDTRVTKLEDKKTDLDLFTLIREHIRDKFEGGEERMGKIEASVKKQNETVNKMFMAVKLTQQSMKNIEEKLK